MSRTRKRWISAEVDGGLVAQLEREAESRGMSRSEAVRQALREWTRTAMEEDEERITRQERNQRQLLNRLDFIVGMIREQDATLEGVASVAAAAVAAEGSETSAPVGDGPRSGALAEARKRARRRLE